MHPGRFDLVEAHDGSRQFALEGTLKIDLLGEFGHPEIRIVKYLESNSATQIEPFPHQFEARLIDSVALDEDRSPAFGQAIRDLHAIKFRDHR